MIMYSVDANSLQGILNDARVGLINHLEQQGELSTSQAQRLRESTLFLVSERRTFGKLWNKLIRRKENDRVGKIMIRTVTVSTPFKEGMSHE